MTNFAALARIDSRNFVKRKGLREFHAIVKFVKRKS